MKEEEYFLSFVLDHHIALKMNKKFVKIEFDLFYYHPEPNEMSELKTKFRRSYENHCK